VHAWHMVKRDCLVHMSMLVIAKPRIQHVSTLLDIMYSDACFVAAAINNLNVIG
jgi:hypothetical protein